MSDEQKPKHPEPLGVKSKPAPLVSITYLLDVTSPDFKAGKKGQTREIERHWAEQLVAEGYAKPAGAPVVQTEVGDATHP